MIKKILAIILGFFLAGSIGIFYVFSQDTERSALIEYVEEQISTPNFQIKLNGIDGALSSDVSFQSITIADQDGVWLEIINPRLVWSRTSLLSGRLLVESLNAEKIDVKRRPLPDDSGPAPEATSFSVPELPVAIILESLDLPLIEFGPDIIDLVSQISLKGRLVLEDGSLDLDLNVERLGDIEGSLSALVNYQNSSKEIDLKINLSEPENGIVASSIGLTGRPPVSLSIEGQAPISELDVVMALDVDQTRILDGRAKFDEVETGLKVSTNLSGPIGQLLPPTQKELFAGESKLLADMMFLNAGGVEISNARLNSNSVNIAVDAQTLADGFLSKLNVRGLIKHPDDRPIVLSQDSSLSDAQIIVEYDAGQQNNWQGSVRLNALQQGKVLIDHVDLDAFGTILNVANANDREISFDVDGRLNGLSSENLSLEQALGRQFTLQLDGDWQASNPLEIRRLDIAGSGLSLSAEGAIDNYIFDGSVKSDIGDLAAFSALSGSNLGGAIKFMAGGSVELLSGGFDLTLEGEGQNLALGSRQIDPLFEGATLLKGGVSRSESGLSFSQLSVISDEFFALFNGNLSSASADLSANMTVKNLAVLDENSKGQVDVAARLKGAQAPYQLTANIQMLSGLLAGQTVQNLELGLSGESDGKWFNGALTSNGFLANQIFDVSGQISNLENQLQLKDLNALIGGTTIAGFLTQEANTGLVTSKLSIASRDISAIAALGLLDAKGVVDGQIELLPDGQSQSVNIEMEVSDLEVEGSQVNQGEVLARVTDLFEQPKINAQINASGITAGGIVATSLSGTLANRGSETDFRVTSNLAQNEAKLDISGTLFQRPSALELLLSDFDMTSNIGRANLVGSSKITLVDGVTIIDRTQINIGGGVLELGGRAGNTLDLDLVASQVPLSMINNFQPQLRAGGTLGGTVRVSGSSGSPTINYALTGQNMRTAQFDQFNVSSLNASASGSFNGQIVTVENLALENAQGLNISARGSLPLTGSGLDLDIVGRAPLNIAEQFLLERGTRLDGSANLALVVSGALTSPIASGELSVSGATITDPLSNIVINGANLRLNIQNSDRTELTFEGNLKGGGRISANGNIGLNGQLPAKIQLQLAAVRYSDLETFSTLVNGNLRLEGGLLASPLLSGNLNIGRTEISVPESFASDVELLSVEHINEDGRVRSTLERIERVTPSGESGSSTSGNLRLNLTINAPNQIFVRGRGLDAELGGSLVLTGSLNNIVPLGGFTLRRGRLEILGQRFDLTQGSISLQGDLDPLLDFTAYTQTNDTQNYIDLAGTPANLEVSFSSDPELPEDEVLANIIFGRSLDDLSPTQIVRLASIANELTGGNSPSLVDGLRQSTGLDDIDLDQDEDGNVAVKAGKYVSDNVYLGTKTSQDETEATINLDITDSLTATGSVNTDGESTLGIFFEKDY